MNFSIFTYSSLILSNYIQDKSTPTKSHKHLTVVYRMKGSPHDPLNEDLTGIEKHCTDHCKDTVGTFRLWLVQNTVAAIGHMVVPSPIIWQLNVLSNVCILWTAKLLYI